ncbi:MAG: hypothetical protein KC877_03835 [Candidatus Kaiserbacteria bacterium]|nr:hypothetical protein [Candidatus Kaiserbacteria bacterium]
MTESIQQSTEPLQFESIDMAMEFLGFRDRHVPRQLMARVEGERGVAWVLRPDTFSLEPGQQNGVVLFRWPISGPTHDYHLVGSMDDRAGVVQRFKFFCAKTSQRVYVSFLPKHVLAELNSKKRV